MRLGSTEWENVADHRVRPSHVALLLAAVTALFGSAVAGGFHFDDFAVLSDANIQSPEGWWLVWHPLQTRPLTWFSFWLNHEISGDNPWSWHALNIILHATAVALLYRFLLRFMPATTALVAALIFAVHPIQTEPVVYIYSRAIVLATICSILCAEAWLNGEWARASGLYIFALLGKEECVALPFVLLFLRRAWIPFAVFIGLSALAGLRIFAAIHLLQVTGAGPGSSVGVMDYASTQGMVILRYLRLLVLPWGFSGDPDISVAGTAPGLLAWGVVAALVWLAIRYVRFGWWFAAGLILLLPSSSILPAEDLAADRRLYLPMVAFSAFAAQWMTVHLPRAGQVSAVAVALLAALTAGRVYVWQSSERVWREAAERSPNKLRPQIMLARLSTSDDDALRILEQAAARHPDDSRAWFEYGWRCLQAKQPERAVRALEQAVRLGAPDAAARLHLGLAYLQVERVADAAAQIRRAGAMQPCLPGLREAAGKLGVVLPPVSCSVLDAVVEQGKVLPR